MNLLVGSLINVVVVVVVKAAQMFGQTLQLPERLQAEVAVVLCVDNLLLFLVVVVVSVVVAAVVTVVDEFRFVPASVRGQVGGAVEPLVAFRAPIFDQNNLAAPANDEKSKNFKKRASKQKFDDGGFFSKINDRKMDKLSMVAVVTWLMKPLKLKPSTCHPSNNNNNVSSSSNNNPVINLRSFTRKTPTQIGGRLSRLSLTSD